MIALSTAGEGLLLANTFQRAYTWPINGYLALFTVVPGKDDGGVECSGLGYSRAPVGFDTTTWVGPTMGVISNASDIGFGTPGGTWGTLLGFAFMLDATSPAQLSAGISFATAKTPVVGTPVTFAAGSLVISALETA